MCRNKKNAQPNPHLFLCFVFILKYTKLLLSLACDLFNDVCVITCVCVCICASVEIVCVPAQHHTQRTPSDKNTSLWCGYVINYSDPHVTTHAHANANVSAQPKKVCFVGDTGYSPVFREIGRELGPIDVSLIPVGAYEPLEHMRPQHCSPEDAVRIHTDLQSKFSFGMHWGTFQYSHEDVFEPPKRLAQAVATQLPPHAKDTFVCMPHGSTFEK
eukprot:c9223_g1_i2.p1 GENE.c9223_g1_i2~~c9223_g1_i2.p1  ORF type:complete len:215 (-),score=51.79 c9223_g1_i2:364-1008(-)